jgi:hypothetical protein
MYACNHRRYLQHSLEPMPQGLRPTIYQELLGLVIKFQFVTYKISVNYNQARDLLLP